MVEVHSVNPGVSCPSYTLAISGVPCPPEDTCTIECPGDVETQQNAPGGAVVTYQTPSAAECPAGTTVTCTPESGSVFPIGTSVVSCAAMNAVGDVTATCSFNVVVVGAQFDLCAVDDVTGDSFRADSRTGYWEYREIGGPGSADDDITFGTADSVVLVVFGITLHDRNNPGGQMHASFSFRTGLARVNVYEVDDGTQHVLTDNNYRNSTCP